MSISTTSQSAASVRRHYWQFVALLRRHALFLYPKRMALMAFDAACAGSAAYLALALYLDVVLLPAQWNRLYLAVLAPSIVCPVAMLLCFQVYRIASRYTGRRDVLVIAGATLTSTILIWSYLALTGVRSYPVSALLIAGCLNFLMAAGSRAVYRFYMELSAGQSPEKQGKPRRVLIAGAGASGAALAKEIRRQPSSGLQLVGFVDDALAKRRSLIDGIPVLGTLEAIRKSVVEKDIGLVIIAIPSASSRLIRDITLRCDGLDTRIQVAPGLTGLKETNRLDGLRDVSIEDLLNRKPIVVDPSEIAGYLTGERVLITGAGGSIGSELVRQIVSMRPAKLFLLGRGENSLFEIEQELRSEHGICPTCLIADIRDYERINRLFDAHRPTVVFHAAAHKHVPMMEANPEEAVTNNILGTRNLARLSSDYGVKRFVMISTDKAVNPTSVMGVSKRIAEMTIQAESKTSKTEFAMVRFGNVLGSRGSLVPTLRKQIARGGPITITDPNMVRYFMTIPEAVQLVIQAGALGGHGTLYLLEMGEPVKIIDLAYDLIRLSGLVPGKDISIEITGLRPGEKLYEEMLTAEEGATITRHERIYAAAPSEFSIGPFSAKVDALIAAAESGRTVEVLTRLKQIEPTYVGISDIAVVAA